MDTISIKQIDKYFPLIEKIPVGRNLEDKIKIVLSIGLFVEKEVTLARAAELAGISIQEFVEILELKNIPWNIYAEEGCDQDNQSIKKYFEKE